jgi:acyl dehydratase
MLPKGGRESQPIRDTIRAVHLEDFRPGDRFTTPEREVTEAEIVAFAREWDPQPFHTDPQAAARSVFGRHIGSGWHTAAITMRLWVEHGPMVTGGTVGLGVEEMRWGPLVPGDRLRLEGEVLEVRPSRSGAPRGVVRLRIRTLNQDDAEVQHMVTAILVPAREGAAG